tara:strand:- start:319 stop:894 length:576 start_codon:yes stop_codon:yes gene_type:complete
MASTIKVDTIDTPDGTGNITFNRPIAGDGSSLTSLPAHTGNVAFPATQVASADANTLDDYEEGVWTPVIGGLSGESGQSYGTSPATYTKIGRLVVVNCNINLTAKGTISGLCLLKGLPFTVGSSSANRGTGSCGNWGNLASSLVHCTVYASEGTTYGYIRGATAGTATLNGLTTSDINNNTYMQFSMSYMT